MKTSGYSDVNDYVNAVSPLYPIGNLNTSLQIPQI